MSVKNTEKGMNDGEGWPGQVRAVQKESRLYECRPYLKLGTYLWLPMEGGLHKIPVSSETRN